MSWFSVRRLVALAEHEGYYWCNSLIHWYATTHQPLFSLGAVAFELRDCKNTGSLYLQIYPNRVETLNVKKKFNRADQYPFKIISTLLRTQLSLWALAPARAALLVGRGASCRKEGKRANSNCPVQSKLASGYFYGSKVFCLYLFGKLSLNKESCRAFNRSFLYYDRVLISSVTVIVI